MSTVGRPGRLHPSGPWCWRWAGLGVERKNNGVMMERESQVSMLWIVLSIISTWHSDGQDDDDSHRPRNTTTTCSSGPLNGRPDHCNGWQ